MGDGELPQFALAQAISALKAGGLLAHSTSSLLGIGALPDHPQAPRRLDELKEREPGRGYVHVIGETKHAAAWVADLELAQSLWSGACGPLTLVLPATDAVPEHSRSDDATVAIRLDPHPVVQQLCDALNGPMISTSLNFAGEPPCLQLSHCDRRLFAHLAGSYVRPPMPMGGASTLVSLMPKRCSLVREGVVSRAEVAELLKANHVKLD
ncbi:MAG TPA: hypothetical protein DCQ06_01835 [Myxococcales bacterium]|nr:hypothetical protein [Myxococcales bacterium]